MCLQPVEPHLSVSGGLSALLPVSLHDAAEVGRLVGDVLQVRLEELRQHRDGALHGELLQRVQRAVVQIRVLQFTC